MKQREIENKMSENYKKVLDAKTKLADLNNTMHDNACARATIELGKCISAGVEHLSNEWQTLNTKLTNEKKLCKKTNEKLASIKIEKSKLKKRYSLLSRQHNNIVNDNKKINEELQVLKDDMARLTEELTRLKTENNSVTKSNNKLTEELSSTKAFLYDISNTEMQVRKIGKMYRGLYEELFKTVVEEKKRTERDAASARAALVESTKKVEEQLTEVQSQLDSERSTNEKLKQEIETLKTANMDREEKAKQVLMQAKNKIVQLTDLKNNLSRELEESRTKFGTIVNNLRGVIMTVTET